MTGVILSATLAACAQPGTRADAQADRAGLARIEVAGGAFRHLIYVGADRGVGDGGPLWVFIEGDGIPWTGESVPADDPTPRNLVALAMIETVPRPAVYLGRPCYLGLADVAPCTPMDWTHGRFSPRVIDSMLEALRQLRKANGWSRRPVILAGFSGGGTLATLMAARVPDLCALITMAAPLDTAEWTDQRGYSRLAGSLDPASAEPLPDKLLQFHLRGGMDTVVPATNGSAFLRRNPGAKLRVLPGVGHSTEWAAQFHRFANGHEGVFAARCKGQDRASPAG